MPTLPAPLPFVPAGGELPVVDADDVRRALPAQMQGDAASAPVREGLVAAQTAMFLEWQYASANAAAQSDPTRASDFYLDGQGEDRSTLRQPGENDDAFRARMLAVPDIVTPAAIIAAVNAILAPYTAIECQLFEGLDRWFPSDGLVASRWLSFIGAPPDYGDRYYTERPNANPGGAWVFGDDNGRYFVIRVPTLANLDGSHFYLYDGSVNEDQIGGQVGRAWIHDGTNTGGTEANGHVASFVNVGLGTALDVYQAIANTVQAIKGQGVRWQLIDSPALG